MPAWLIWRSKYLIVVFLLYVLSLVGLRFVDFSPVKPALRAVAEIQPGMTESEVRTVVDRHFPEQGRFPKPSGGQLLEGWMCFQLDLDDGRYNAAVIAIRFDNGVCQRAEFHPD